LAPARPATFDPVHEGLRWPYGLAVPVEFLSDEEAARFGRYDGPPTRAELEKLFFLEDADKKEV